MTSLHPGLHALADHFGIARDFWDWKGRYKEIKEETIIRVLAAFDVDASTPESCAAALRDLEEERWLEVLPPVVVTEQGQGKHINVHVSAGHEIRLEIELEQGGIRPTWQVDNFEPDRKVRDQWRGEATFWLGDDLPTGYHRLVASTDGVRYLANLIVTPRFVGLPARMNDTRVWGYGTQLYSLTSQGSWGVGDLIDLSDLIAWSGTKQFADYVLINPLHMAQVEPPMEPSPYLPASRRFINPLYIRPEAIAEYLELDDAGRRTIEVLRLTARAAGEKSEAVERDAVWKRRLKALRIIFDLGLRPARQLAFEDFVRREGEELRLLSLWCVLSLRYGQNWRMWPTGYRSPHSAESTEFAEQQRDEMRFWAWLQWIAQEQVSVAQRVAEDVGMRVGIIGDLAVGVGRDSAETWMMGEVFAHGVSVGAPPDAYNQSGQNWSQPPWRPDKLAKVAYAPFKAMVRAALRGVGGVRIDHILGLFRLWWFPEGMDPQDGTYVRFDHEALVGILALEAQRSQALVIGEDLGTVEPWVRDYLARRGLLGTSVLWFEYGHDGGPLDSDYWREYCMASVTTHDLPPTIGYLAGDHVRLRHQLGLLTESLEEELEFTSREQAGWLNKLVEKQVLDPDKTTDPVEVMLALHRYLGKTPAKVLLANLTDAVGERRMQNQPGTTNEYPNWRVPLADETGKPISLEEIFQSPLADRLAAVMNGLERQPESRWE